MAIQFRYQTGENGQAIIQFSHQRFGESALATVVPELEVNWAYYRHRFDDWVIKAGRFAEPFGMYSEVLTVGTLTPFYRPDYGFYPEGAGTVDGIGVERTVRLSGWDLDFDLYGGGTEFYISAATPVGSFVQPVRSERTLGGRMVLGSPFDNVRLTVSYQVLKDDGGSGDEGVGYIHTPAVSLHLDRGRFEVNGEVLRSRFDFGEFLTFYAQAGGELTNRLTLLAQYESGRLTSEGPFPSSEQEFWRDRIVGLNYTVNPNVVLKLEGHSARGWGFDSYVPEEGPPGTTRFGIAGISVSF
jgi:hypothetical protein